jgi:tRNA modification GTPase
MSAAGMNPDDTIVAISSAAGAAARGIVRLSGPEAIRMADRVFVARPPERILSMVNESRAVWGDVCVGSMWRVPGFALVFVAPRSYTRQDVVELHLIGAPAVLGMVVEGCLAAGARRAEPGEFTLRAFLNGAMDLSQAYGVAGMIAARSDEQLRAAERLLHGELSRVAADARESLDDLLSLVEGAMDFADEPIEFIKPAELRLRLDELRAGLAETAAAGARAERWERLPRVVLTGRPNAGKSSLLNRLTGLDRAICSAMAGTTRDVLSAPLQLGEQECLLVDAAGIGEAAGELDQRAQRAARAAMASADVVLVVIDGSRAGEWDDACKRYGRISPPERLRSRELLVGNKCDLIASAPNGGRVPAEAEMVGTGDDVGVLVSARTGEGLEQLKAAILMKLAGRSNSVGDSSVALMAEHHAALGEAAKAIDRAIELAGDQDELLCDSELIAAELRSAADSLAAIAGREPTEAMLGRIFSRFCVGK